MKYQFLDDFRTSTLFSEKFSHHFKDLHKPMLLANLYVKGELRMC